MSFFSYNTQLNLKTPDRRWIRERKAVAEMTPKLLLASVLLLLLCSEVLSYSVKKRGAAEDKTVLTQIQDAAQGYIDYVSDVTNSWVEKVKSLDVSQRILSSYNSFISTVDTYKNILTDQVVYFWHE
ncbi:apolipoprotein C-II-like [Erythrolamprus reginae]|uniref:apolipoprotein C-II-like n=1 Tax=Erythrolamprus reginae TaxID=121349 RepID=UPI00396CE876